MSRENDSDLSTRLTYLLIGGGIGAVLALLFAPKSGQELRGDIAEVTRKGIDRTRESAQQLGNKAGEYYETGKQKAGEYYDSTRERASDLYSAATDKATEYVDAARDVTARKSGQITAAIDAGRQAYNDERRKTEASAVAAAPSYPTDDKS